MKKDWKKWFFAASIRAVKTFAQATIAAIGTTALITEVNWAVVFSTGGLAAVLSILTSLAGLPEVKDEAEEEKNGDADR